MRSIAECTCDDTFTGLYLLPSRCCFSFDAEKLSKALPDGEELAKLLPDLAKIGENFSFLKGLFSKGGQNCGASLCAPCVQPS